VKDKCNITGNWPKDDPDVRWACEYTPTGALDRWSDFQNSVLKGYKNVYCALCNPMEWSDVLVDNCSYDMDTDNVEQCHFFPTIFILPPYKNIFCRNCNGLKFLQEKDHAYQCDTEEKYVSIVEHRYGRGELPLKSYFSPIDMKISSYMYMYPKCTDSLVDETNNRHTECLQTQMMDPITVCAILLYVLNYKRKVRGNQFQNTCSNASKCGTLNTLEVDWGAMAEYNNPL
jgi:hypothetical protein